MDTRPLLLILLLTALCLAADHRKIHRLAGGHLRIINPDPDDSELMKMQASGARDKKQKTDDEKKTLSQQVADGKYGLIQTELFSKPPKRLGVLSYEDNPEVANDNKANFGGLNKNEIWLAENHLLVLRGGTYPPPDNKHDDNLSPAWTPIDNYNAPLHQVKIPKHPKVPPPFPVQFTDDGPLQILGTNSSRTLNGSQTGYAIPPPEGFQPDTGPIIPPNYPDKANATPWPAAMPIPVDPSGEYPQGVPFPPFLLNGTLPPYFASLPPGAAILPPPGNQTEQLYDEDDPSIYYPPPYSFYYPKDNSSIVPPGPLVPGIILPPPPNFFAPLEETTTMTTTKIVKTKPTKPLRHRKPTTTEEHPQIYAPTTQLPPTDTTTTRKPFKVYPAHEPYYTNEIKPTRTTTKQPKVVTILSVRQKSRTPARTSKPQRKNPQVTVLRPVKPDPPPPVVNSRENEIPNKPFVIYGPPRAKKPTTTATPVPLKFFTTSNEIETNSVTQSPIKVQSLSETTKTTLKPAQYYFYEEEPLENSVSTRQPPIKQDPYVNLSEEYYVATKPTRPVRQRKPQYIYVSARPYNTHKPKFRYIQQPPKEDTFNIHIARLQNQINQYYTTPRTTYRPVQSPKPLYQFSFQAANYQPQQNRFKPSPPDSNQEDQFRPLPKYSVQIQQAIEIIPTESTTNRPAPVYYQHQQNYQETPQKTGNYYTTAAPNYIYEELTQKARLQPNVVTTGPIAEYSFEVTPNPVYQGFYTKPDEGYFDDNTKKYFTMFGKKLPTTTPLPSVEHTTPTPNIQYYNNNQQGTQYQRPQYQKPVSLETDTIVNYVHPRPPLNPDAEVVSIKPTTGYPNVVRYPARPAQFVQPQKPPQDESPEIIKAVPIEVPADGQDGSFISYQLPGDQGAHFYFLTPQLVQRTDQGSGYFFSQSNNGRSRRNQNTNRK